MSDVLSSWCVILYYIACCIPEELNHVCKKIDDDLTTILIHTMQ